MQTHGAVTMRRLSDDEITILERFTTFADANDLFELSVFYSRDPAQRLRLKQFADPRRNHCAAPQALAEPHPHQRHQFVAWRATVPQI
jgi:hypothetical protein